MPGISSARLVLSFVAHALLDMSTAAHVLVLT
jgi:hypothetical protein